MVYHLVSVLLMSVLVFPSLVADGIPLSKADFDLEQDRLAELFHIRQFRVQCTASQPYRTATRIVDCYRDGKKVLSKSLGLNSSTSHESISVSCQIVDLDRLPLGPSSPGHVRASVKISSKSDDRGPSSRAKTEFDIDKLKCDVADVNGAGHWPVSAQSSDDPTPLYWQMRCVNNTMKGGGTLNQLLENNPGADILVVSLSLKGNSD